MANYKNNEIVDHDPLGIDQDVDGNLPEPTEIDRAMESARRAQQEEILHEQVRMERLHVSAIAMQGLLASTNDAGLTPADAAELAVTYADALLRRVVE